MPDVVLTEVADRIATVTMNRPDARNALNRELRHALSSALGALDQDPDVDVVVLTGADPAFCAGIDLKEMGSSGGQAAGDRAPRARGPFPAMTKPVIGAVNGVAVTGGLEVALSCSFLVASERAHFADTHARVGVMPAWGSRTVSPQAIGLRRAREMSISGNFVGAGDALAWGLVNHVVPHEDLLPTARRLAADIAGNDQPAVRRLLETYDAVHAGAVEEGRDVETRMASEWRDRSFDPAEVARRRDAIMARGRSQSS